MLFILQGHKGVKGEAGEPGKQGHMVRTHLSLLYLFTFVISMAIGQIDQHDLVRGTELRGRAISSGVQGPGQYFFVRP